MDKTIDAIYERNVLRPLEKLNLGGVRIRIEEKPIIAAREIREYLRRRLQGRDLVKELSVERERLG